MAVLVSEMKRCGVVSSPACRMLCISSQNCRRVLDLFRKVPALHMQMSSQQLCKPVTNYINNGLFA